MEAAGMHEQQTWEEVLHLLHTLDERLARSAENLVANPRPDTEGRWPPTKIRDTVRFNLRQVITHLEEALSRDGSRPRAWINTYYRFSSRVLSETDLTW